MWKVRPPADTERRKLTQGEAQALLEELRAANAPNESSARMQPRIIRELLAQGPSPEDERVADQMPRCVSTSALNAQLEDVLRVAGRTLC